MLVARNLEVPAVVAVRGVFFVVEDMVSIVLAVK